MVDIFSKEKRSSIMAKIRSKNTMPEKKLFLELRKLGMKYSRHYKIYGTPDIAFPKEKMAVFIDGDFWHGYNWKVKKEIPPKGFWRQKITANINRDRKVKYQLSKLGWRTIRIWEHDIEKNPTACVKRIVQKL
jgi:DNA mismatch endonuclease (patch repair protein)